MDSAHIQDIYDEIDSCFNAGGLGDATYQFAADIIQLLDPDEQDFDVEARARELKQMSLEELARLREDDIREWEEDDPGVLVERFRVGQGSTFSTLKMLIECTDFKYIKEELLPMYLGEISLPRGK